MVASTVLVVEDDRPLLNAYTRILTGAGHQVLQSDSAEAVLELLDKAPQVDLIMCDIGLPGVDGITLLRQLRQGRPDVPVVLVTGAPTIEGAVKAVEYGAFRYLTKPTPPEALIEVVETGLRLRRVAQLQREAAGIRAAERAEQTEATLRRRFEDALVGLWMAYQPIIDWDKRRIYAYEALVRTSSASMTSPMEMFDAAEKLDRVYDLGRMVRRRVAGDVRDLDPSIHVFVNLHPSDLLDEDLFAASSPLLAVAPRVVLEITERAPLDHIDDLRGRLNKLVQRGFRIALDDLGVGYSGLASFTQIEPKVVKFDMALTRNIEQSETKQKLVRSMISLCKELGIVTVAEGVETTTEHRVLVELGCPLFQGFLFAKPAQPFCSAKFEF